jgi:Zn-dependent protease with chaperone function
MIQKLIPKSIVLVFFLVFFLNLSRAQSYIPLDTTSNALRENFITKYQLTNISYTKKLKTDYDGKLEKYLNNNYKTFSEEFLKEIKRGNFIFDEKLLQYAHAILEEIKKNAPEVKSNDFQILIAKDNSLNAYCFPDETFVLNLGLFSWLENEDQVAGVLCHEIAHVILKHSLKSQERNFIDETRSKNTIEALKEEKYDRSEIAFGYLKRILYDTAENKKNQEFQADSLGYALYKKSKYSKAAFLKSLQLMQKYDSIKPIGLNIKIYKEIFDLPNQKFNEKWLLKEDFSSYNYTNFKEKINKDSISSHPDTKKRIERIKSLFPETLEKSTVNNAEMSFLNFQKIARFESVPNWYYDEKYGIAIYECLLRLEEKKDPQYYKEWLGKAFKKIVESRKSYTLNRHLDRIDAVNQSESYQQFLSFMWNLKLNELIEIANFYEFNKN